MAFIVSAVMSAIGVLFAYFSDSLPGLRHSEVDRILIDALTQTIFRSCIRISGHDTALRRQKREELFEKFLASLADQQLVTGFAVIIAAFAQWHDVSLYTASMAWTMATVSLVTHLGNIRLCPK